MSCPSQKARRGTSQHTSSCWRAARDVNKHVHPLSTKCSVFNIAPEGRDFWLVFTQNLCKSPLRVKSYLVQGIILLLCACVYTCRCVQSFHHSRSSPSLCLTFYLKMSGNAHTSWATCRSAWPKNLTNETCKLKISKVCTWCFLQNSPTLLQSHICCIACCSLYKQLHLTTRGPAWEGPVLWTQQAATATSWGDDALHAFTVQQKAQAEPQKKRLWCVWMLDTVACAFCSLRGCALLHPLAMLIWRS